MPTEAAMFRVVALIGAALVPVFVVSVLAGPGWAGLLLVFEIGIAIGIWWRRRSAARAGATGPDRP